MLFRSLGVTFLVFLIYEYHHAYTELNLKLSSGAYGSTFYMLTSRLRVMSLAAYTLSLTACPS